MTAHSEELKFPEDGTIAYEEGWRAYEEDLDLTDNPYDHQQQEELFEDWRRGWRDALEDAESIER